MSSRIDILSAAKKASEIIEEFELRSRIEYGYTRIDPALVASHANVPLIYKPLEKLLGSFIRIQDSVGILVNNDRPRGLVHMTCAHELGHYFLGHESTADLTVDYGRQAANLEQNANFFAYSLLAPKWLIARTMREQGWSRENLINPIIIYQLSLRLGISYTAMIWSLSNLNILSSNIVNGLLKITPKSIKQKITSNSNLQIGNHDVWLLNERDKDHIIEPAVGDKYIFDLPNHAGAGMLWEIDQAKSEGFEISPFVVNMALQKNRLIDQPIIVGGKKSHKYTLEMPAELSIEVDIHDTELSIEKQRQQIALAESKNWVEDEKINEFSLFAEFELIKNGFSTQEQEKRIASVEKR